MPSKHRTLLRSTLRVVGLVIAIIVLFVLFFQHQLIYHPRPYGDSYPKRLPESAAALCYPTSQGEQTAFFLPPKSQTTPRKLWVFFAGNASLALDWTRLIEQCGDSRDGFLLIDYPGYGRCQGSASPDAIQESAQMALRSLPPEYAGCSLNVLGHSLGAAAGLAFSAKNRVDNIILIAPFTALHDMAKRVVGLPLSALLRHDFDNRSRLAELSSRANPPQVTILHGGRDEIIPPAMGQTLARAHPQNAAFELFEQSDHNSILWDAAERITGLLQGTSPGR